jgi:hypothetical protein
MGFKEEYLKLKEKNMTDQEIMKEMLLNNHTFYKMKEHHGLCRNKNIVKRKRKNYKGFTEEMLQTAEANGIPRRLAYKRVGEYFWSHQRAITEPINVKVRKGLQK